MVQAQFDFRTVSPINVEKLSGQNRALYDYLQVEGNTIHCFHEARRKLKIGYLNSRISDLTNRIGIVIHKRRIKVNDIDGNPTDVTEYSMYPFKEETDERR